MKKKGHLKFNLTLIELVISLAILATLSSILLSNFADIEIREREKETIESGKMLKNAILGNSEKNGISKFLSDLGRWPEIFIEKDSYGNVIEERYLAQLYDRTIFPHISPTETMFSHSAQISINKLVLDLPASPIFQNYYFPKVIMPVGWQGSYVNLTFPNKGKFSDAWGNPWKIMTHYYLEKSGLELKENYRLVQNPQPKTVIDGVLSLGADNTAGGVENGNSDYTFSFSRNENMANLTVTLKVRDEDDFSHWNEIKLNDAIAYLPKIYQRGNIVFIEKSGIKHYYTCTVSDNNLPPNQNNLDYSLTNTGWRYGTTNNIATLDSVRVLLFSPAKRSANGNSVMESGFFRFIPYLFSENNKNILFPALSYCRENNDGSQIIGFDVDATSNANLDENFSLGRLNENQLRTHLKWQITPNNIIPSTFRIEKLVPGRRQIFAFIGNYDNAKYTSTAASSLDWIEIKPGENKITLNLESKK